LFRPGAGEAERDRRLLLGAGDAVHLRGVRVAHQGIQAKAGGEWCLSVALTDAEQADLVHAAAVLPPPPELAEELSLEALQPEGLAGVRTLVVAQSPGEEALQLLERPGRAQLGESLGRRYHEPF